MLPLDASRARLIDDASLPWIPFLPYSEQIAIKYFRLDPVRGEIIFMVRCAPGVRMPRHYFSGSAICYTISGRWTYAEHPWIAGPGSVVVTPAAVELISEVEGDDMVQVLLIVIGDWTVLDEEARIVAVENWRTALQRYHDYCSARGIAPRDLTAPGKP